MAPQVGPTEQELAPQMGPLEQELAPLVEVGGEGGRLQELRCSPSLRGQRFEEQVPLLEVLCPEKVEFLCEKQTIHVNVLLF